MADLRPLALAAALLGACTDGAHVRPDVILVSIDTLRADGLSAYGNPRPTSPHLDALAGEGFLFERCLAPAPETAPSHATLFTGLETTVHRVANLQLADQPTPGLDGAFETLAERFAAAGYRTAAITDGGPLGTAWNLQQGFEHHDGRLEGVEAKVDRALAWLEAERGGRPLFLFLHTYQVHLPYVAPLEWAHRFTDPAYDGVLAPAERETRAALEAGTLQPDGKILLRDSARFTPRDVEHLRRLYEGEIAFTDHQLERLWAFLREDGRLERTVVVVTSDHGEEFGEHGFFGHRQLHVESLHVPLILRLPAGDRFPAAPPGGARIAARVGLVDVFRTLLDAAELPAPREAQGRSLLEGLRGGGLADAPSVALTTAHFYGGERMRWRQSVRAEGHALLRDVAGGSETLELYDLARDGAERAPLPLAGDGAAPGSAALAGRLAELLDAAIGANRELRARLLSGGGDAAGRAPDRDTLEELESLGYLGEDAREPSRDADDVPPPAEHD